MDGWLKQVNADSRNLPLAQKIIQDKPATLTDRCTNGIGTDVPESVCDQTVQAYGTPRASSPTSPRPMTC